MVPWTLTEAVRPGQLVAFVEQFVDRHDTRRWRATPRRLSDVRLERAWQNLSESGENSPDNMAYNATERPAFYLVRTTLKGSALRRCRVNLSGFSLPEIPT